MANIQAPWGLRWLRNQLGSAPTAQQTQYQIAYNYGTKIATGDIVKLTSGYVQSAATTDHPILGVFVGCEYFDNVQQKKVFFPQWATPTLNSTILVYAYIIDDPQAIFEVQAGPGNVTQANIGSTAKFLGNATPNSLTGQSGLYLDTGNIAATTTYPLMITGLGQRIGNDNTSNFNTVEVKLNDQVFIGNNS